MAMYSLSAILNLIHLKKNRNADYIVVLGSGIIGKKVTPLLAARIERGIELLKFNPHAVLIMSGGQGPGEDIPESVAMAAHAVDKGVDVERIIMEQKSVSTEENLSLIHISEPTRQAEISYAVFCLKKKKKKNANTHFAVRTSEKHTHQHISHAMKQQS